MRMTLPSIFISWISALSAAGLSTAIRRSGVVPVLVMHQEAAARFGGGRRGARPGLADLDGAQLVVESKGAACPEEREQERKQEGMANHDYLDG